MIFVRNSHFWKRCIVLKIKTKSACGRLRAGKANGLKTQILDIEYYQLFDI